MAGGKREDESIVIDRTICIIHNLQSPPHNAKFIHIYIIYSSWKNRIKETNEESDIPRPSSKSPKSRHTKNRR
jgi:hypothetical protein